MESKAMAPPKRAYKRRASTPAGNKDSNKLQFLIHRIANDLGGEEINKYWDEIDNNGGFANIKASLKSELFKKLYSKDELEIIQENLDIYRRCMDYSEDISIIENESIDDIQLPRAAVFNESDSMSMPVSIDTSDSEFEVEIPGKVIKNSFGSEVIEDEGKKLYKEFKNVINEKLESVEKDQDKNPIDVRKVLEQLHKILDMQSEYLQNEKEKIEHVEKIQEISQRQAANCNEMERIIESIKNSINDMEATDTEEMKSQIENDFLAFGQRQRQDIWKTFLKKQMDSLKQAITNNLKLD